MNPIPSGSSELDNALGGGLQRQRVLHVYGVGGMGKTTLALQFAVAVAREGHQIFYVHTEGKFPVIRLKQIAGKDFEKISPLITVVSPTNFSDQGDIVSRLESLISSETQLLIFDTISSLYRIECGDSSDNFVLNRKLNQQLGMISSFVKSRSVALILVNQVRGDISGENEFRPVADSITSYWSDCSLLILRAESKGYREFKLVRSQDSEPTTFVLELLTSGFK
jgi:RecA/RadA recombinase